MKTNLLRTNPSQYLAALIACGAMLAGEGISAQTQVNEYSARPLPPVPTPLQVQRSIDPTGTQTNSFDSTARRYETLFTIESPPLPPSYNVSARIVRPTEDQPAAAPETTERERSELISSSAFNVAVKPQAKVEPSPALGAQRVAELPKTLSEKKPPRPNGFFVSFENKGHTGELEPVLDTSVPEAPIPEAALPESAFPQASSTEMRAAEIPANTATDEIKIDPDSFEELETSESYSADTDAHKIERENGSVSDDQAPLEEESQDDDLAKQDEDDLQPEPRQFGVWPKKSMQEVTADIRNFEGKVPADESSVLIASTRRHYHSAPKPEKVFAWAAPQIRYQPLYFEDVQLERYGQTKGLVKQPLVSGFKFFRDAALLPLNASIDCPGSCDSPLGFCRPGAPCNSGCSSCQR